MFAYSMRVVLAAAIAVAVIAAARPCEAWSILHPLSSDNDTAATPPKPAVKPVKKQPSTLDKATTSTKNFFSSVGNTLTGKKPDPPKPSRLVAVPKNPAALAQKKETKTGLSALFQPKEEKKPKTVKDWMGRERVSP